jgi:hypothetical protein
MLSRHSSQSGNSEKDVTSAIGRTMMEKKLTARTPMIGFKMFTSSPCVLDRARSMPVSNDEPIEFG